MKLGLISCRLSKAINQDAIFPVVQKTLREHRDLDLLVCTAGCVNTPSQMQALSQEFGGRTLIAIELAKGSKKPVKPSKDQAKSKTKRLWLIDGRPIHVGEQQIGSTSEMEGKSGRETMKSAIDILSQKRKFIVDKRRALWIHCGEILLLHRRRRDGYVRFRGDVDNKLGAEFFQLLGGCDLIIHPTHDRMGRVPILDAKCKALSTGRIGKSKLGSRAYARVSNWNARKKQEQSLQALHKVFRDGKRVEAMGDELTSHTLFSCYQLS